MFREESKHFGMMGRGGGVSQLMNSGPLLPNAVPIVFET